MDENTIALFDDYLSGNLLELEAIDLENRLDKDEALAASFLTFTNLTAHLHNEFSEDRQRVKQTIATADRSFTMNTTTSSQKPKVRRLTFIKYGIAASVALFFGVLFTLQWSAPSYEDYAFDEKISLVERGGDETAFAKAEKAFNTANYEEAVLNFDTILAQGPNAEISYYKGIALTELNRFTEGEVVFQELANGPSAFKFKAQFYKALSLLKQDKKIEAAALLKKVPKESEVYNSAQELLDKLD